MYGLSRSTIALPWRINLSSRAALLSGGDAIVISVPKSGRTWLRSFYAAYFCARSGHPFSLEPERYQDPRIPRVIFTHDVFEHRAKGYWWDRIRGKFLVPAAELRRSRIILLARDPRDAFVSHFVQLTRPSADAPQRIRTMDVSEMLRDPFLGIEQMVASMNYWLREFDDRPDVTLLRYEDLKNAPAEHFQRALHAIGETEISPVHFEAALEFSAFEKMKKMEAADAFDSKILQTRDKADPESANVRRGKVGGFTDYLSEEDQAFANAEMRALHPRFGYSVV